jgi:endonuclease G, mitochondrial
MLTGCSELVINTQSEHLFFGNPSGATSNLKNDDNFLMIKPQFALSYNRPLGRANWVSWELNQSWLGNAERQNDFRPDPLLPSEWDAVTPGDYRRSGYDRGHMVPSADRTRSIADNSATFVMTNILPQSPDINQGPWNKLEEDCRNWLKQGKTLQIIAGGYGKRQRIGQGKTTPPERVWKAILVLDGNMRPSEITTDTPLIAVDMPNQQGNKDNDWQEFQVSVDEIEKQTGYDLFSEVNPEIQGVIEQQVNRQFAIAQPKGSIAATQNSEGFN